MTTVRKTTLVNRALVLVIAVCSGACGGSDTMPTPTSVNVNLEAAARGWYDLELRNWFDSIFRACLAR